MNENQRKELGLVILSTATYYGRQNLDRGVISMMIDDLCDLEFEKVIKSYADYRRMPKNKTFPLPANIRELIVPNFSDESIGRDISARIIAAIPRYGYNNAVEASSFIGEIGWNIVKHLGGWSYLCENMGLTLNPSAFAAQVRDMATDHSRYGAMQIEDKVHQLPHEEKHMLEKNPIMKLVQVKGIEF